jgi:thiosulfate dehydrogenase [quinone] large subunit
MSTTTHIPDAPPRTTVPIVTAPAVSAASRSATRETALRYLWAITRLCMAWVFLWPFFDKLLGLGHNTTTADAWINGGNPSKGFLSGSIGPFAGVFHSIAGAGWVNWLFMLGLIALGLALLLGICLRFAAAAGSLLLLLMWSASLPPDQDVWLDNHIVYALLLIGLALVGAGNTLGLGSRWTQTTLVRRFPWLA